MTIALSPMLGHATAPKFLEGFFRVTVWTQSDSIWPTRAKLTHQARRASRLVYDRKRAGRAAIAKLVAARNGKVDQTEAVG